MGNLGIIQKEFIACLDVQSYTPDSPSVLFVTLPPKLHNDFFLPH